jgi:hypothetical protein
MKKLLLIIILISCISVNACAQSPIVSYWQTNALAKQDIIVDGTKITIRYGGNIYFITRPNESSRKYPLYIAVDNNIKNNFIQVKGKTYNVQYNSSNQEIAPINECGVVTFKKPGKVVFTIKINDYSVDIPVDVYESPFIFEQRQMISPEELVKKLGFPDKKTYVSIKWPQRSAVLDNIFYSFGGTSYIEVTHWHYKDYPTLLFVMYPGTMLSQIKNCGWDCGYDLSVGVNLGIL